MIINSSPKYIPKSTDSSHKTLYMNVRSIVIHNSHKVKKNEMSN